MFAGIAAALASLLLTGAGATGSSPEEGRPVVLVHGFDSHPEMWRGTGRLLREAGRVPIFVHWRPKDGAHTKETATEVVLPAIRDGLVAAGFAPDTPFDAVTHSLGGLVMRQLLEHPDEHDDPSLPDRVGALAMLSPPHHGARTGIATIACGTYRDPAWREIICDLKVDSAFLQTLGDRKPSEVPTRYLSIGVATAAPFFLVPLYDGDGDGRPAGHDNAVMAESGWLPGDGSSFVVWRGWDRADHFTASCSAEVNQWIIGFLNDGTLPEPRRGRVRGGDACKGLTRAAWREEHGYEPE